MQTGYLAIKYSNYEPCPSCRGCEVCGFCLPKYGNYYSKDHAKPINTFYWQNAEFFNV
jgi:hypothetical protein